MTSSDLPYYLRPNQHQRDLNARMLDLIPELDSKLVKTPMLRSRWYSVAEEYEKGVPCFIPADYKDVKSKLPPAPNKDYLWMPKRGKGIPAGYYHFSTQEANFEIFRLFQMRRPRKFFGKKTPEMKLDSNLHDLLENRILSDLPDDNYAARTRYFLLKAGAGKAKAAGRATLLPVLTSSLLLSFSH